MQQITVTTTDGLMALARLAHGRNRSVYEDDLEESLDPDGLHMLGFTMIHNDEEFRTQWYIKMKDDEQPHMIWLDIPFGALEKHTSKLEVEEEN